MERIRWATAIFCLLLLVQIVRSIRREHIRVEYSMAWFAAVLALLILALWDAALTWLASLLGLESSAVVLLSLAGIAFVLTFFRFSIDMSTLKDHNIVLSQKVGMLEWEIRTLRRQLEGRREPESGE